MNIFFYRYGSIAEPDIIKALKEGGFEITEYTREITDKNYQPSEAVADVSSFLQEHPCDCAFSINFFPFLSEVCNIFHIRYLSWTVDSPVMELYTSSIRNEWNRTFIFDRADAEELSAYNKGHVFHLPLGASIENKKPLFEKASELDRKRFSHDITFVGSLYTEKCPYDRVKTIPEDLSGYLDGIMAAQEQVYGYYFIDSLLDDVTVKRFKDNFPGFYRNPGAEDILTDRTTLSRLYIANKISSNERIHTFSRLAKDGFKIDLYTASDTKKMPMGVRNRGTAKTLTEMPLIFAQSKINLNISSKAIRTGLPLRIFDIMSCGGFCLTNYQSEIPEFFTPGSEIAVYGSYEELTDLIRYYLSHESERRELAEAGYRKLKSSFTLEQQVAKMMVMAFDL